MPIVSSEIIENSLQADGRRWISERHVDQLGVEYVIRYLAQITTNAASTLMGTRAEGIGLGLKTQEIAGNLARISDEGRDAVIRLDHSTAAENAAALREAYRSMTRLQAIMTGDFLASLTDTQLRNAFGMTAGQVTTLRSARLTPAANAAAAIRAASGA